MAKAWKAPGLVSRGIMGLSTLAALGRDASWSQSMGPGAVLEQKQTVCCDDPNVDFNQLAAATVGDVNLDGVEDLALQISGGNSVTVHFLDAEGTVIGKQSFGGRGGFGGELSSGDQFADAIGRLGDLDDDGVPDLVVGAPHTSDNGTLRGSVWIVFLNPDGTVKAEQEINDTQGGFVGILRNAVLFGTSVAGLDDLDGDGVEDIVVGAPGYDPRADNGANQGSVWIVLLKKDGTVKSNLRITNDENGFLGPLVDGDTFGWAVAGLGDVDGDGVNDLAVGANAFATVSPYPGSVWILLLNPDGTVKAEQKITEGVGGFTGDLDAGDQFGGALASLGDLDQDGVPDLAVGAQNDDDLATDNGAVWVLFLTPSGTVREWQKLSSTEGGVDVSDLQVGGASLGTAIAGYPDYNSDGVFDLLATSYSLTDLGFTESSFFLLGLDDGIVGWGFPYGAGVNPPESLSLLSGRPVPGTSFTVGLDNPIATQSPGAATFLFASLEPDLAFPNGTFVPGFGMSATTDAPGELLISLQATDLFLSIAGPAWAGPGMPASVSLDLPSDPSLIGQTVYAQGLLVDPIAALGVKFALTNGLEVRLGP